MVNDIFERVDLESDLKQENKNSFNKIHKNKVKSKSEKYYTFLFCKGPL